MKRPISSVMLIALAIATLMIPVNAFSQKKAKTTGKNEGVTLEYSFPEGKALSYSTVTNIAQTMDFNGQTIQANVLAQLSATVTGKGNDGKNIKLNVTIDTLKQMVDTPQGSAGGLMTDAMGKSFTMTISPSGKELDLSDAEKITIKTESVEATAAQQFMDFFPNIPEKTLNVGDTWMSNDTSTTKSGSMSMTSITKSENKFEGLVKMNGYECAKISSTLTGTREQTAQTMGMDVATSGTFTGTAELYFAVKEGIWVKSTASVKMNGTIEIGGAQNMSMPLVADMSTVSILKK